MKRTSLMQGDQPVQRVQKDLVNSSAEDSFREEDCQIVFIKPALVPYVDESFENLEVNNNSEEVSDEIDNSIVFLEDEQQSQSRSSEFDSQDMTIGNDRSKKANVFKAPSRKRVSMQSFPIRKKFKKGPSKFEKKFDSTLLDRFLGARCDKNRRKDKLKKTFVDEEITFKFKRPDRKLEVSEQGTDIGESSQKDFVDLTLDDGKESPFQHNHLYPSGPESLKLFQLSEPQNNQVANEVSKNVLVNNLTSPCSDKSSPLNPSISEVLDRPENEKNPMISVTDVCKDSDVFHRLVKNPMIIVTDLCKDSNFDATKNIRDLSENVVHSYDDENTKTCANSPLTIFISSLNLEGEGPLVTDEPITQKPLNEDQENDILVQKSTDLEELYATAFNELESFLSHQDNNEAVMTVLEDLVKSQLGDKIVTVPDISDDANDYISDSKLQILEPCWVDSPFPTQEVVRRISRETWLSDQQIIGWFVERNKAEINSIASSSD